MQEDDILDDFLNEDDSDLLSFEQRIEQKIRDGYEFRMGDYISKAFDIFQQNIGYFIGFALLYMVIQLALNFIPFLGSLGALVINAPLGVGYAIMARKISRDEPYEFGDFFRGFDAVLQLFLGGLIVGIFVVIGSVFLIIPGIFLGVCYVFVSLIIYFENQDFWPAMEYSRRLITKNWWSVFGFVIILVLLNFAGALVLGIGLLVTIPVSGIAIYVAYEDILENQRY
ncbi:hypothetical protein R9C00_22425 [Flammeovirgaceae bacterium SG7u.111]|nr:hypothetical protein [Flammeovirgaceae bacterium SG7u.132]WPO34460.1 hypothetical protein R9C00_22425 [Flammeovirgaceae bacterium SG7u.111]